VDLVLPWLKHGGNLYWGGSPVGYYSATPGRPLNDNDATHNLLARGIQMFLGPSGTALAEVPTRSAAIATPFASALGLQYQDAYCSPSLAVALGQGAMPLGYVGGDTSSITAYSFGPGRLVDFGGYVNDVFATADAIARLLMSDAPYATGPPTTTPMHRVGATFQVSIPLPLGSTSTAIAVVDPQPEGVVLWESTVSAEGMPTTSTK
jgi:hypothetical protein